MWSKIENKYDIYLQQRDVFDIGMYFGRFLVIGLNIEAGFRPIFNLRNHELYFNKENKQFYKRSLFGFKNKIDIEDYLNTDKFLNKERESHEKVGLRYWVNSKNYEVA